MLEIEETELCVVCNKPGPNFHTKKRSDQEGSTIEAKDAVLEPNKKDEELTKESDDEISLLPQLRVIFLLQQIFKHPLHDKSTLEAMQELGDPSEWFEICKGCSDLVDSGIDVLRKLKMYEEEYKRVVLKLGMSFSSSYWSQPWNLEGNCILVRNESGGKSQRRLNFRNTIRKIETASMYGCEMKPEPEEFTGSLEDCEWPACDVGIEYPCKSPISSPKGPSTMDEIKVEPFGQDMTDVRPTTSDKTGTSNDQTTSRLDAQIITLSEFTDQVHAGVPTSPPPKRLSTNRGGKKHKKISKKSKSTHLVKLPTQTLESREIFVKTENEEEEYVPPEDEDDHDDDSNSVLSDDYGEHDEVQKKPRKIRKLEVEKAKNCRGPGTPLKKPTEIEHQWFYEKCHLYLDMNLVEYPPPAASNKSRMRIPDTKGNCSKGGSYFLKGNQGKGGFPCPSCDDTFTNKFHAIAHIQNVHLGIKKPWKCNQCPYRAKVVRPFRRHIQDHNTRTFKSCTICRKFTCREQTTLDTHVIRHQKDASTPTCHECQQSFDDFENYVEHMVMQHGFIYKAGEESKETLPVCQFCNKLLSSKKLLQYHLFTKHKHCENDETIETYPVCSECGKRFLSRFSLANHMERAHPEKFGIGEMKYFCEQCGKEYKSETDLKSHLREVHLEEPQNCRVCGFEYMNAKKLRTHVALSHPETRSMSTAELEDYVDRMNKEKPFGCKLCSERFPFSVLLFHHQRTDHNTDKFNCDVCGKGFATQQSSDRHKKATHLNWKISCDDCGKTVTNLAQHRRKNCPVGKQKKQQEILEQGNASIQNFGQEPLVNLLPHHPVSSSSSSNGKVCPRKSHTGVKNSKAMCDICGKEFSHQSSVKKHKQVVHMNMKFSCEDCGKSFTNLLQHRSKHCPMRKQKVEQATTTHQQLGVSIEEVQGQHNLESWIPVGSSLV